MDRACSTAPSSIGRTRKTGWTRRVRVEPLAGRLVALLRKRDGLVDHHRALASSDQSAALGKMTAEPGVVDPPLVVGPTQIFGDRHPGMLHLGRRADGRHDTAQSLGFCQI